MSYHQGMARLVCLVLLTLAMACGGGGGGSATPLPATASARPPTPTLAAAPAAESTPGITPAAGVQEEQDRAGAGAPGPTLALVVRVGAADFAVEPAVTPAQRIQGLSGREVLAPRSGMLFIFEQEGKHSFWMKEMRFPLDLVWIGSGCTVVDLTRNAPPPAPGQALNELPSYLPASPARYVLEINAGEADLVGLLPGDRVGFSGSLAELYGC